MYYAYVHITCSQGTGSTYLVALLCWSEPCESSQHDRTGGRERERERGSSHEIDYCMHTTCTHTCTDYLVLVAGQLCLNVRWVNWVIINGWCNSVLTPCIYTSMCMYMYAWTYNGYKYFLTIMGRNQLIPGNTMILLIRPKVGKEYALKFL